MPMRILYVEGCRDGTVGGSHISLYSMVANLDRKQFHPLVVFYSNHHVAEKLRVVTKDVYTFKNFRPLDLGALLSGLSPSLSNVAPMLSPIQKIVNFIWFFLRPSFQYARFLRSKSVDIVHLNNSINTNHDWMLAAKIARVKLISHERGISESLSRSSKLLGNSADLLICISKKIRETLLRHGLSEEKTVVVYNGIDTLQVRPKQDRECLKSIWGIAANSPVIGVVGNIKHWKGQETVVRATAILKKTWPDIKCVLVGGVNAGDPYKGRLEEIIQALGVEENVVFTGFQENPADFIDIMDIVVHASIEPEPFGRVNIEAMYLNKAVVSTNVGGPTEIFEDGKNGILIEPNNPDLLAQQLALLLSNPELRQRLGKRAHATVLQKFTIEQTVRKIEGHYRELCCGR